MSSIDIADDLEVPLIAPNSHGVVYLRNGGNFKFGLYVNGSKSQPAGDKSSVKVAWSRSRDTF